MALPYLSGPGSARLTVCVLVTMMVIVKITMVIMPMADMVFMSTVAMVPTIVTMITPPR